MEVKNKINQAVWQSDNLLLTIDTGYFKGEDFVVLKTAERRISTQDMATILGTMPDSTKSLGENMHNAFAAYLADKIDGDLVP